MSLDNQILSRAGSTAADRAFRNRVQRVHVRQLWIFLGSVLVFFTLVNAIRVLSKVIAPLPQNQEDTKEKKDEELDKPVRPVPSRLRRTVSAVTTSFRIVSFRLNVPIGPGSIASVSELSFIFTYIAAMFVWLLVDTRDLMAMMYQDRAALIGSSQIPLMVALAGKNNIISWLTGVSHEKLNVLHRASARTNFIFFWIHALTRVVSGLPKIFDFTHDWMRSGALSLTALTLATLLSLQPIRHAAFEFFLVTHIILILIFIIGGYYHAKEVDFGDYIWPGLLIWGFDRAIRLGRLIWNNKFWNRAHPGDALVELLSDDTIRLTLRRRISWTPGQHAYVILPSVSTLPFEAHPFTIASIPEDGGDSKENDVVFLVRGRGGFTQRLREHATQNHGGRVPAFLDGPYGCPPDLRPFSTCILVAGGSGISYTLPLLLNLVSINSRGGKSAVRKIVFIWAIRDTAHLKWASKTLSEALARATPALTVEPRIYITGKGNSMPNDVPTLPTDRASVSSSLEKEDVSATSDLPVFSSLSLIHGRPNIKKVLDEEIEASFGPVSVDVAGPSSLADSVRQALTCGAAGPAAALKGASQVTLHVETFGMVRK